MDIEKLKLILDALSNAGDNAMTFALLWLAKDFILGVLTAGVFGGIAYAAYRLLVSIGRNEQHITRIAHEIGTCAPLSESELNLICERLRKARYDGARPPHD